MEHCVGLDVSLKLTAICIVDQTGKIEREGMVASNPEAIAAFIKSHAPHVVRVGLETGATSTWLWTELNKMGLPIICIDARHAKAALRMQINKSDRNDAVRHRTYHAMWMVQGGPRAPGAGAITALCFHATIDDPTRFKRSRSVGAYVGLTTRRYASGEVDWTGRISRVASGHAAAAPPSKVMNSRRFIRSPRRREPRTTPLSSVRSPWPF
jgi:transposase